jgi:hypothetical protein
VLISYNFERRRVGLEEFTEATVSVFSFEKKQTGPKDRGPEKWLLRILDVDERAPEICEEQED